jgi:hypothetical protein
LTTQATQTVKATKPQHISLDDMKNLSWLLNQAAQTVEATKPQPISLDDIKNLSWLLNQATQTVEATKPQPISLDDIKNLSWLFNSDNPNSQSYKTTAHFFGRYEKFELDAQHRQLKQSKLQNHSIFLWTISKI